MRIRIIALGIIGVTGCCSNVTQDPTQGGLMGGVCGLSTGAYDQRIADREARLAAVKGEHTAAVDENARLTVQSDKNSSEIKSMRKDVGRMQTAIAGAKANTAAKQQQKADLQRRLAALEAELRQLQASSPTAANLQRKKELEQEILDLWTIVNAL
jgi:chromosome segregation ATPase